MVFVPPTDALSAFNAGKIEAWATFGVYQALAEQKGARGLITGEGINSGLTYISAYDGVQSDPLNCKALSDVLQFLAKAFEWAQNNPDEYARVFAKVNGIPPVTRGLALPGLASPRFSRSVLPS